MYTNEDIFNRFKEVKEVKINNIIYKVEVSGDIITLKHRRAIEYIAKSEVHKRWLIKDGKLHYISVNIVLPFEVHSTTLAE